MISHFDCIGILTHFHRTITFFGLLTHRQITFQFIFMQMRVSSRVYGTKSHSAISTSSMLLQTLLQHSQELILSLLPNPTAVD